MSSINTGSINANYPQSGVNNSTQGFRDNFAAIKNNFVTTKNEITALETDVTTLQTTIDSLQQPDIAEVLSAVSGSDTIIATSIKNFTAYTTGQRFQFRPSATNATPTVTLNINGRGAQSVKFADGTGISVGTLTTNSWVTVEYNGTDFVLLSGIGFLQSGTNAVSRTVQSKLRERVSILDFAGVDPTGSTDSTAGIQAAITYAKTLTAPELIVDYGTYLVSNKLVFDLPNNSTITFLGKIRSSVSADPAIRIGSSSTNTFGLTVTGIKVERISIDTSAGSTGVELRNLAGCMVDVRWCFNFNFGIVAFGDQANGGFSYNEIHMGLIHDNKTNLYLTASGAGYCNENNFYGGSFNHSSSFPAGLPTVNLLINHFPTSTLNNNRFYGPSFEDNSLLAVAAVLNGDNNVIYWPRMENPATLSNYQIQFAVNARECRVIGNSYGMLFSSNISDLGTGNMYETREGTVMRYQTGTAPGNAVLKLQGYFTGSAKALSVVDPAGVERGYITGDGDAWFQRAVTIQGIPTAGAAGALTLGTGTQSTVGAAGGASALPATPLGYLRVWIGTTEVAIPYYNKV